MTGATFSLVAESAPQSGPRLVVGNTEASRRLAPDFVAAIEKTGRKQLIIAGVVTDVCVAFPALSAIEAGYQVFAVVDASGTFNKDVRDAALMRMVEAGVQPMNWFAVACELHRDWRNDIEGLGALFSNHIPNYRNLMTSYFARTKK